MWLCVLVLPTHRCNPRAANRNRSFHPDKADTSVQLHSSKDDYAKNIRPRVRYHARPQALPPYSEQPEQGAEKSDSCCRAYSFLKVANAEYNRLEKDGQCGAACDRLKLLLQDSREKRVPLKIPLKGREVSTRGSQESLGEEALARHSFRRLEDGNSAARSTEPRALRPERCLL